ncbi:MAG: hypothetical protein APF84_08325 [Gracilibacter sp. BRH_c7a]|nr:MAG: hypothetical protein APF84_08325 [Gracilibacter sp. BRH_c7a]
MFQEDKQKQERYILVSQAISFFLLAMAILTAISSQDKLFNFLGYYHSVVMFLILLPLIIFIRVLSTHYNNVRFELIFNIFFLVVLANFLFYLNNQVFNILLIMPIILTALKSGFKYAIYISMASLIVLFYVSHKNDFATIDVDIMYMIVFLLVAWLLGNMRDTENEIRKKLERQASYDGLTDLLNHRSFQNIMDTELVKAKEQTQSLSLILLDIDYFKVYNDSFGHPKGDYVLKKVASIISLCTPPTGYCARYGGEEFALILPEMNVEAAKIVAEKIRKTMEETNFSGMEVLPRGKLTVSIGLAEYPLMATNKEKLIQKADEALYKAKFISKNKVETYYSVFDELSLVLEDEERDIFNSIRTLTMVINAKDKYTYGHSERTMELARRFAEKRNMPKSSKTQLIYSSLLHDIGKIEVSRDILNKPAKLNNNEWEILKGHPQWGADIIRPLKSFEEIGEIVLYHHENFDGSGYPKGLKGLEIPYGARVLRIIDSFDAITTNRPYKFGMTNAQAIEELRGFSGIHYDSIIFEQFAEMILNDSLPHNSYYFNE